MSKGYKPLKIKEKSLTQQHMEPQTNINTIVATFKKTRVLPQGTKMAQYGDFTKVKDFHEAMNQIIEAQDYFNELPADLRARFGNDPAHLIAFLGDKENKEEAIKMGIIQPEPAISETPVKPAAGNRRSGTPPSSAVINPEVDEEPLEDVAPAAREPAKKKLARRIN